MKIPAPVQKYLFLFLLAGISICLLVIILRPTRPPEPEYQGKKLTDWASEIDQEEFLRKPGQRTEATEQTERAIAAIQQIGTNALPTALDSLEAHDSWLKIKFEEWMERRSEEDWPNPPRFQINIKPAWEKKEEGANIIWALGPMTKPIVPDLVKLLRSRHSDVAENAMYALPGAGTNAIPPLLKLLDSPDENVRLRAAITLGDFFNPRPPSDDSSGLLLVAGSENFRSQARAAVPVLLQCLGGGEINNVTRTRAARALGLIKEEPSVVVPALLRHLQNDTNGLFVLNINLSRRNYLWTLGRFGTNAMLAVPMLVQILKSNSELRANYPVLMALQKIDPQAAKPFLEKWKINQTNYPFLNR